MFFLNVLISFDHDSRFHNDVPVVNSTDYYTVQSESIRLIDHLIMSVIRATIRSPLYKDVTSHSIYKFS